MGGHNEKNICVIISCIMMVTFIGKPCEVLAANATVFDMKKDKGIKRLTDNMCFYVATLYCMNDYEKNKKVNVKMDVSHKYEKGKGEADRKQNYIDVVERENLTEDII